MTTYRIVSSGQKPLGAGEINAGQTISVSPGDVFIIDSTADKDITFASASGGPHAFEVIFNDSNSHDAKITVGSNLKPTVTIPDNTNLSSFDIDAQSSNGLVLTAGDNASLGKLDGSKLYADTITAGDSFTATGDWNTTGGDDVITIGNGADFEGSNLKTGVGNDSVTFGDQALFGEIDTEGGNDTIRLGGGALAKRSLPVRAMILCTPARAKISIPLMAATGLTATQARKSVRTPRISKPKQLSVS